MTHTHQITLEIVGVIRIETVVASHTPSKEEIKLFQLTLI